MSAKLSVRKQVPSNAGADRHDELNLCESSESRNYANYAIEILTNEVLTRTVNVRSAGDAPLAMGGVGDGGVQE